MAHFNHLQPKLSSQPMSSNSFVSKPVTIVSSQQQANGSMLNSPTALPIQSIGFSSPAANKTFAPTLEEDRAPSPWPELSFLDRCVNDAHAWLQMYPKSIPDLKELDNLMAAGDSLQNALEKMGKHGQAYETIVCQLVACFSCHPLDAWQLAGYPSIPDAPKPPIEKLRLPIPRVPRQFVGTAPGRPTDFSYIYELTPDNVGVKLKEALNRQYAIIAARTNQQAATPSASQQDVSRNSGHQPQVEQQALRTVISEDQETNQSRDRLQDSLSTAGKSRLATPQALDTRTPALTPSPSHRQAQGANCANTYPSLPTPNTQRRGQGCYEQGYRTTAATLESIPQPVQQAMKRLMPAKSLARDFKPGNDGITTQQPMAEFDSVYGYGWSPTQRHNHFSIYQMCTEKPHDVFPTARIQSPHSQCPDFGYQTQSQQSSQAMPPMATFTIPPGIVSQPRNNHDLVTRRSAQSATYTHGNVFSPSLSPGYHPSYSSPRGQSARPLTQPVPNRLPNSASSTASHKQEHHQVVRAEDVPLSQQDLLICMSDDASTAELANSHVAVQAAAQRTNIASALAPGSASPSPASHPSLHSWNPVTEMHKRKHDRQQGEETLSEESSEESKLPQAKKIRIDKA